MFLNINLSRYCERVQATLYHQEVNLAGNTWKRRFFMWLVTSWINSLPSAVHIWDSVSWNDQWFFSPSSPTCVSLAINHPELLVTGWADSHTRAQGTSHKQRPVSSEKIACVRHRESHKTGPRCFHAAAVMQTCRKRGKGPEGRLPLPPSLAHPETLLHVRTPAPTHARNTGWRWNRERKGVGVRNNSSDQLQLGCSQVAARAQLPPILSGMSLFSSQFSCVAMVWTSNADFCSLSYNGHLHYFQMINPCVWFPFEYFGVRGRHLFRSYVS